MSSFLFSTAFDSLIGQASYTKVSLFFFFTEILFNPFIA